MYLAYVYLFVVPVCFIIFYTCYRSWRIRIYIKLNIA